jgi:hypothetical protein
MKNKIHIEGIKSTQQPETKKQKSCCCCYSNGLLSCLHAAKKLFPPWKIRFGQKPSAKTNKILSDPTNCPNVPWKMEGFLTRGTSLTLSEKATTLLQRNEFLTQIVRLTGFLQRILFLSVSVKWGLKRFLTSVAV